MPATARRHAFSNLLVTYGWVRAQPAIAGGMLSAADTKGYVYAYLTQ